MTDERAIARILVARLLVQSAMHGISASAMRDAFRWVQGTSASLGTEILYTATIAPVPAAGPVLDLTLEALKR